MLTTKAIILAADGKIILDLWDDEPLDSSQDRDQSIHNKHTDLNQYSTSKGSSLETLKSFSGGYTHQNINQSSQSFSEYSSVKDLPRSERPTPQLANFSPQQSENYQSSEDDHGERILRDMPSTRPAPQVEVDQGEGTQPAQPQSKEEVITKRPKELSNHHDLETTSHMDGDWLSEPNEQPWDSVAASEVVIPSPNVRSVTKQSSSTLEYEHEDNLQMLLDVSKEEERLRSWMHERSTSMLKTKYDQEKTAAYSQPAIEPTFDQEVLTDEQLSKQSHTEFLSLIRH